MAVRLQARDPEGRQTRESEPREKDQPVVEREREPGKARGQIVQAGDARPVGDTGEGEGHKNRTPSLRRPAAPETRERQRKEDRASVPERHSGAVVARRLDGAPAEDAVGEGKDVRKKPPRRFRERHRLAAAARVERRAARAIFGGARDRFEEREELRAREQESEDPRTERRRERRARAPSARPGELPREVDGAGGCAVKERFRMTSAERQPQRRRGQTDRGSAGRPGEPPQPEQQQRKRRRRRPHAPADPEYDVGREAPSDRAGHRGERAQAEVGKEEERREQGEKQREGAGERERERDGQPEAEPGRRVQDAGLRRSQKRVAGEHEAVPERETAVRGGLPDGRPPREVREGEVRQDRVGGRRRPARLRARAPGVRGRIQVGRPVEPAPKDGFSGEDEWQERENDCGRSRDGAHESPGEPHGESRRGGVGQPERESFDPWILDARR